MERWRKDTDRGNPKHSEKNVSLATFTITTLTWNVLISKTSFCDEKQVTNCVRNDVDLEN
jgi:hypothetical protein